MGLATKGPMNMNTTYEAAETADVMEAVIGLEDNFHDALSRLPGIDNLNEYIGAIEAVIGLEDNFRDVLSRLPGIDNLNERIEAMQTLITLAEELPEKD
jgi:hypothetical protein